MQQCHRHGTSLKLVSSVSSHTSWLQIHCKEAPKRPTPAQFQTTLQVRVAVPLSIAL
jgi:hypothetical protein